ncbi:hypothetical protein [Amycolatopsis sp. NBC_00438]
MIAILRKKAKTGAEERDRAAREVKALHGRIEELSTVDVACLQEPGLS